MKTTLEAARAVYDARNELSPLLEKMDFRVFSKFNMGYLRYQADPTAYFIDMEMDRFLYTTNYIYENFPISTRILDIGVFIPVLPIALSRLGYHVDAVEKLSLYENTLDAILEHIRQKHNINIHNVDIISGDIEQLNHQYDIVLLMAVLEHLNGSPKRLLEKCRNFLKSSGNLFIEVPNIASLPKRISLLIKGKSPLPDYSDYFLSDYPFEGHNREYTYDELQYALTSTGFEIQKVNYLNVKSPPNARFRSHIMRVISRFGPGNWRDVVWTVSRLSREQ